MKKDSTKDGPFNLLEVLSGDEGKFELAVHQLKQSSAVVPANLYCLYTLGRAYFYDGMIPHHLFGLEGALVQISFAFRQRSIRTKS